MSPKGRRFALALTGDILPTRQFVAEDTGVAAVFRLIQGAECSIGNFEMPLTSQGEPLEKLLNIRADPAIAKSLQSMGVKVLNVANNHSVDYGWTSLKATIDILKSQGFEVVGAGSTVLDAQRPAIVETHCGRVGTVGFSCLLPTGSAASETRPGISPIHINTSYEVDPYYQMEEPGDISAVQVRTRANEADIQNAELCVARIKKDVDTLIVSIHWGYGSGEQLADYQRPLAERLIKAGADVIHGHHPHAVHGVGFYDGRPIFYSLGTLVGQQVFLPASDAVKRLWGGMSPDGYVALLEPSEDGVFEIEIVPTRLNACRIAELSTGREHDEAMERLGRLSSPLGAKIVSMNGRLWAVPAGSELK